MEKEHKLTPQQSLALISDVISQTKENIKNHSFIFLLWGWTLTLASLARFFLETQTDFEYYFLPFPILVGIAIIITIFHHRRKVSETYLNSFIKKLWMALAVGFMVTVFVSVYQKVEPFTYTLILAAIGTSITGSTMKFKPFIIGGAFFLFFAICCVFIPDSYKALVHGIAIIIGYLIPGYLLKKTKS